MNPIILFNTLFEYILFLAFPTYFKRGVKLNGLTKPIKRDRSYPFKSIQLVTDSAGNKFIAKSINHFINTIYVSQLLNEQLFLQKIADVSPKQKLVYKNYSVQKFNFLIKTTTTFQTLAKGRELSSFSQKITLETFDKALNVLQKKWKKMINKDKLPKTNTFYQSLSFPIYALFALIKNLGRSKDIFKLINVFYKCGNFKTSNDTDLTIAHRDLTPENIILDDQNNLSIIDFEVARISNRLTDLALFPRFYIDYLSEKQILKYINSKLSSRDDRLQFLKLTIFYTLQFICIEIKTSKYYKESLKYIDLMLTKIIAEYIEEKKTIAEKLYFFTLNLIGFLNSILQTKKNAILCYHSVDNSTWRFSTPVADFKKQLAYLKTNFKVVSLKDILTKQDENESKIAITFDDGYEDVFKNAFPIMKSMGIVGTIFIVGDPKKSNTKVLGNNKNMLSKVQIEELLKSGWTVGYHTKTHSSLRLTPKKKMNGELKSKYNYFAYPNGYYDKSIINKLIKLGYSYAFSIDGGKLDIKNNMIINRIPMEGKITDRQFHALMSPIGMVYSHFFMRLLKFKEFYLKSILTI